MSEQRKPSISKHVGHVLMAYIVGTFIGAALAMPPFMILSGEQTINEISEYFGACFYSGFMAVFFGWIFMFPGLLLGGVISYRYLSEGNRDIFSWLFMGTAVSALSSLILVSFYPVAFLCGIFVSFYLWKFAA